VGTMREVIRLVRERLGTKVLILVRADSGFGTGRFIDFLFKERVEFVLGLPSNAALTRLAERAFLRAAVGYKFKGEGFRVFHEFSYSARKNWSESHRVVVKVEMTQGTFNPRYVVTSLKEGDPEEIYECYCARGEQENRIKEFKLDIDSGRTSCSRFTANRFRLLIHTAAYALMNGMRKLLAGTSWQKAQIGMLRLRLLKVGARVVESARRVWVHLPTAYPNQKDWEYLVSKLQAMSLPMT
jgi:Transposase DDE domain group 1